MMNATARRDNLGPTLGVLQTGSQNQQNPNAPTFEVGSIEWTLSMEEVQVHILRIEMCSSTQVPRAMFLHLL